MAGLVLLPCVVGATWLSRTLLCDLLRVFHLLRHCCGVLLDMLLDMLLNMLRTGQVIP
jgi:hypothetical protein